MNDKDDLLGARSEKVEKALINAFRDAGGKAGMESDSLEMLDF